MPSPTPEAARELDRQDPLSPFRERFRIADPGLIYLDGNSLGRLPLAAVETARRVVEREWGETLIAGWNGGWIDLNERIGAKIARLIGAAPDEVIMADSTSVNLFKLALAALRAQGKRRDVVTDALNFPSDLYILQSALDAAGGGRLRVAASRDDITVAAEDLEPELDDRVGLVSLSHTAFKSAFVHNLAEVTTLAHRHGALVLWDVSHSVGAMPLSLRAAGADLAVGCTYKYLNGGPGAPAFLYVRRELQERLRNPIGGWLGHARPFDFSPDYEPAGGIRRWITGTPPIVSLSLVEPGVDLLLEAGLERLRTKSLALTDILIRYYDEALAPLGFRLGTPRESDERGSHVTFRHPEGYRINRALIERMQVIPDFREPDCIRLGVTPLYTTFEEVHRGADALRQVVEQRLHEQFGADRAAVT